MTEETASAPVPVPELPETTTDPVESASADMDVETSEPVASTDIEPNVKRPRDEEEAQKGEGEDDAEQNGGVAKKLKVEVEKSVEEKRLENESSWVKLGPKEFGSSVEMFDYFYKFLHHWPPNLDVNKYEYIMLLELIKKGHAEPDRKIGVGIKAFQVRFHPVFKSRCFFLIREDDSSDDFSFRKCVDHILSLPEDMKVKSDVNKALGGKGRGGGGRGGGRGRGRGRGRGHGHGGKNRH